MDPPQPAVLDGGELNTTDRAILDLLARGRVTAPLIRDELEISREYASERLTRLREHGHVERVAPGLYELVDDPRTGAPDDDAVSGDHGGRDEAESGAGGVPDHDLAGVRDALVRALEEIPDGTPGRAGVEDALALLDRAGGGGGGGE